MPNPGTHSPPPNPRSVMSSSSQPGSETVWLNKGQLHNQAISTTLSEWYECRDLNPGSSAGLESIIPNTAATIRAALQEGDDEVAYALLDLLSALGGQPV